MTTELTGLRDEIGALNEQWADIIMLDALVRNLIFSLDKLQKSPDYAALAPRDQQRIIDTISDVLNTSSKELNWAMDLPDTDPEQLVWYRKAKHQILEDMQKLFE